LSTRQKRNSRLDRLILPAICLLLLGYFIYHALNGRYGVVELAKIDEKIATLEFSLAAISNERKALEQKVLLLHDGTLERDMLDEQARYTLNLLAPDEISIPRYTRTRADANGFDN
jgi:cell division protein FtsB